MDMDCGQFSVIWIKCQFVNHKVIIELSLYPLTHGTKYERLNPACFVLYQIIQLLQTSNIWWTENRGSRLQYKWYKLD